MTRLNLVEATLLDLSGELGPKARGELVDHLSKNETAEARYESIAADYALLASLPQPKLSAPEKARFTGRLKRAIHRQLDARHQQLAAARRQRLVHYALAGLSAAAAALIIATGVGLMYSSGAQQQHSDQVARLNRTIERLASTDDRQTAYDQALADVDSSIREIQAEGSSMAAAQTNEMAPLLDALASIPATSGPSDVMFDVPMGGM